MSTNSLALYLFLSFLVSVYGIILIVSTVQTSNYTKEARDLLRTILAESRGKRP